MDISELKKLFQELNNPTKVTAQDLLDKLDKYEDKTDSGVPVPEKLLSAEDILTMLNDSEPVNPNHNFKGETSKVKDIHIIFDDGDFCVAKGMWEGKHPTVVCRWYSEGVGYPQTHGHPTWMVFPANFGKLVEGGLYFQKSILN